MRQIIMEVPNDCGRRQIVPTVSQLLSSVQYMGALNLLLAPAPSNFVTPLYTVDFFVCL